MNAAIDQLAKSLTGKNSLSECSLDELRNLAVQYPFFGPAHFLLSQRLKKDEPAGFEKQVQKTALFFQNPLWLQYLTDNYKPTDSPAVPDTALTEAPAMPSTEPVAAITEETGKATVEPEAIPEKGIAETDPVTVNEPLTTHEPAPASTPLPDIHEPVTEPLPVAGSTPKTDNELQEESIAIEEAGDAIRMPQLKFEPADPATALTFEPYHTVDYFASQGVSLNDEEKTKDRFGQQLKSFTEWLKTMKRLPSSEVVTPGATPHDPKVDHLAAHSVAAGEVVTETMAEIWEKQGNPAKAIETYHKLSLLNPAKSAYFAAKIEHLKHS